MAEPELEMNHAEVLIGIPGSGKSWYAMERAGELAIAYNCPLVIHDAGSASIRKKHNPFHETNWKSYRTAAPPATLHLYHPDIVVVNTGNADDVLAYVDKVRRNRDCVVLVDEVSASRNITQRGMEEPWRTRLVQRRALRTAQLYCMQTPTMASKFLTGSATNVKVFRLVHRGDLKVLADIGFTEEQIARVPTLERGEYIELESGFSDVVYRDS